MATRPAYIYQGGSVLMHAPMQLQQSDMYGFFVRGDLAKLQATIDTTLNEVAAGRLTLKALSPYVLLTFNRIGHADSADPADRAKGWLSEGEVITWIMVGAMDGAGKPAQLYWHPCHIFVDDAMALVNGRELFGYSKYLCDYAMPAAGAEPLRCAVALRGFQPFARETKIARHPLLEVNATVKTGEHKPVHGFADLIEQAFALLQSVPDFLNMDGAGWAHILSLLRRPRVDQILLKQFPDSAGVKAVYQALLAVPADIERLHSGRLLGYEYECSVHAFASFPLDQTLGLQLGPQSAVLPFHIQFDFTTMPGEELVDNSAVAAEKIAILGGGVGAMTAAYYLSQQPGRYAITVYQSGWRLGGKGASGRNAAASQRIEEHGLHVWFGCYANAFAMMRQVYASLDRPAGAPLATWRDAFKLQDYVALAEDVQGQWRNWSMVFPALPGEPGDAGGELTPWQMALALFGWIAAWAGQIGRSARQAEAMAPTPNGKWPGWLRRLADAVAGEAGELGLDVALAAAALATLAGRLAPDSRLHGSAEHRMLAATLAGIRTWLHARYRAALDGNDDLRRLLICLDLGITVLRGLFEDGVLRHGFDVINDIDLRDWLRKHGGDEEWCVNSAPVRACYDLVFAYEDGDTGRPNVEAGTLLRAMARICLGYRGGIMFKMQAGMGDCVFAPLYELLRRRGVRFKFFHKVEELLALRGDIDSIRVTQQVALAAPGQEYQPLVTVRGLACWPGAPDLGQVEPAQAALLRAGAVDLESYWSDWPQMHERHFGKPPPSVTLRRGVDFDKVVFGVPVGALPALCPQLLELSPALKATSVKLRTVATQAYQLWLNRDLAQLGWTWRPGGQQPLLSAFAPPFDTWAAMDQVLAREDWPAGAAPKSVAYFCGALAVAAYPPFNDGGFVAQCNERVRQGALKQLCGQIGALWPAAGPAGAFPWQWLVDAHEGSGAARFDGQYWRANVDPAERYVMSVVGSSRYRLATQQSGFANLYLTGDWIKTGLNAGCVEAAVMAGMQAARAICGSPGLVRGETDF
ncbi:NAD(P)-binding protein [Janthinobacterium fluminis]|uniref:NAD(P)-binding protein n=1 Tax=Janthinobacterium fluminis TaxID=2987524 RepID=A0ABT5JUK4_9BURK|nr:NAD(P)-binding protein [Janthinobacterium fluminis]MDC8756393.1 NAD(P)-binding protein [Janthinobacterium fluminis]